MPKPTKGPRLGGSPSHERIILANLASQLFEHGSITTTEAKAKRLRPLAEKLISKAKRGDVHAQRQVYATLQDRTLVKVLVDEIAPKLADRDGGYTRITKIGNRQGDNAPMAVIEVISESVEESRSAKAKIHKKAAKASSGKPATKSASKTAAPQESAEVTPEEANEAEMVAEGAPADEGAADTTVAAEEPKAEDK